MPFSASRGGGGVAGALPKLQELLLRAVADDPAARPRAKEMAAQLEALLARQLGGDPRDDPVSPD